MLALLRMDWTLNRRLLLKASPLFLIFLVAAASAPQQLLGAGFLIAMVAMCLPLFHYLGPTPIEPFLWALPVSRTQIVVARYLSSLLGLIAGLALPMLVALILHQLRRMGFQEAVVSDLFAGMASIALILAAGLFLYLPFHFRFGGDRGVGYFMASLLGAAVMATILVGWDGMSLVARVFTLSNALLDGGMVLLKWALGVLTLGIVSLTLSVFFYRRRASQRPWRPRTLITLAASALALLGLIAALGWSPRAHALNNLIAPYVKADAPGCAVLVMKDGKVLLRKAYGLSDIEHKIPLSPDQPFRIGSVTKQFTAALVMLLVEDGRIDLAKPIGAYVPEVPRAWARVTVEQCLNHTGGIPDFTNDRRFERESGRILSPAQILAAYVQDKPLEFEPGSRFDYSNSGYLLLGMALEKVSGRAYAQLLQERICLPLGLRHTRCGSEPALQGYVKGNTPSTGYSNALAFSAGALDSTVDDLAAWTLALHGGKVLKPAGLARMTTSGRTVDGKATGYGYGLGVSTIAGHRILAHSGHSGNFCSVLAADPAQQAVVVVLFNTITPPVLPINRLLDSAFGLVRPDPKAITLPEAALEAVTGTYETGHGERLRIWRKGGALKGQVADQDAFELSAENPTRFFIKGFAVTLEFRMDQRGQAAELVVDPDGMPTKARRIP